MGLPETRDDALRELQQVRGELLDLKTREAELLIIVEHARQAGGNVIALTAIEQVLGAA